MTAAVLDAFGAGRDQCRGDAILVLLANQVVGVIQFEGQAKYRRYRRQRDVSLVPVETDAGDCLAFPCTLADDATVDQ